MGLFENLQDLMLKYHFRPEKKLSQFFCINEALLLHLVNLAKIQKGDVILEIGPGTGLLTRKLLDKTKKVGASVVAIEPDSVMLNVLSNEFATEIATGELKLIEGSALEVDYSLYGVNKIVSLPPYHISSDLLSKISLSTGLTKVILVLDRGFVQKLTAFEGLTEYVALTVLVNLNAKVEIVEDIIEQSSFFPAPNCISSVVQLDFDIKNNSRGFFVFLKELFRHKNKDLQKSLRQSYGFLGKKFNWSEKDYEQKIQGLDLPQKKVYLMSPPEFLKVFDQFNSLVAKKKNNAKKSSKKRK